MSHFTIIALLISFDKKKMANETTFFEAKPHSHGIVWYSDIVTLFIQLVRDETSVDRIVLVFFLSSSTQSSIRTSVRRRGLAMATHRWVMTSTRETWYTHKSAWDPKTSQPSRDASHFVTRKSFALCFSYVRIDGSQRQRAHKSNHYIYNNAIYYSYFRPSEFQRHTNLFVAEFKIFSLSFGFRLIHTIESMHKTFLWFIHTVEPTAHHSHVLLRTSARLSEYNSVNLLL